MAKYVAMQPLVPGRRVDVLEKDARGYTIGAWYGYWNYKTGRVALYPNVRNKYVNWPGGRKPDKKKLIDDTEIMLRRADGTNEWFRARKKSDEQCSPLRTEKVGETWRDRKLPMQGQEAMKF